MSSEHSLSAKSETPSDGAAPGVSTVKKTNISDDTAAPPESSAPDDPEPKPSTLRTVVLLVSVFLSMFLVALDRTIISTAIPKITDEFDSLSDVGWYGSAYLLTCCAFQLLFGKIYAFYSVKGTFLTSIVIFEAASALCGAAPTSTAFIVGRAFAGVGAADIFAGTIMCIVYVVPLHKRPQIQGLFGALFGLASVVGPLIGGAFTSNVTWRWCFYINLPIGGLAMTIIALCLKVPDNKTNKVSWTEKLTQLDIPGTICLVPGIVCLLLALQWGGSTYAWNNGKIIALLVVMSILLLGFVAVQIFLPRTATLPPRLFKQRSIVAAFWQTLCVGSSNYLFVYFLPIWFQSIKGASAVSSGIRLLPIMLSMVIGSVAGGFTTPKIGYYVPFAIIGASIMSVGAGLLTTFHVNTGEGMWIGYQVVYGLGLGMCFQIPNLTAQTVLPKQDVPMGLALMLFGQMLGAAVFVSVGENILTSHLKNGLSGIPGIDTSSITSTGVTSLLDSIPDSVRPAVLGVYNSALRQVFLAALIVSCLTVLGAVSLQWKSILKKDTQPKPTEAAAESGEANGEKKAE